MLNPDLLNFSVILVCPEIQKFFSNLGCDTLSMLLILGISVTSATFVTLVLFLVVYNTVGVILPLGSRVLFLFWVEYARIVIFSLHSVLLSVNSKSAFVPSSVSLLVDACTSFGAILMFQTVIFLVFES